MIDAMLDEGVEFFGPGRHFLGVVYKREAEVHPTFVDFDVRTFGRRQFGLLRRYVIAPGMVFLDGCHAHGGHGERLMQVVAEPENVLVVVGPEGPQGADAGIDHGRLAIVFDFGDLAGEGLRPAAESSYFPGMGGRLNNFSAFFPSIKSSWAWGSVICEPRSLMHLIAPSGSPTRWA